MVSWIFGTILTRLANEIGNGKESMVARRCPANPPPISITSVQFSSVLEHNRKSTHKKHGLEILQLQMESANSSNLNVVTDGDFEECEFLSQSDENSFPLYLGSPEWSYLTKSSLTGLKCTIYRKAWERNLYEYFSYGTLDVKASLLYTMNLDIEYRKKWDPYVLDIQIHETIDGSDCVRWCCKFP